MASVTSHIELTDRTDQTPVLISIQAINFFTEADADGGGPGTSLDLDGWDVEFVVAETPDQVAFGVGHEAALFLTLTFAEHGGRVWVNASKVASFQAEEDGTSVLAFVNGGDDLQVRESLPVIRDMLSVQRRPDWMQPPFGLPPPKSG
jgi:hypothetical protein